MKTSNSKILTRSALLNALLVKGGLNEDPRTAPAKEAVLDLLARQAQQD